MERWKMEVVRKKKDRKRMRQRKEIKTELGSISLSCNEQHSLSLFLCLSKQMCHFLVFSMKTKRGSFFLLSSLFLSPSLSSLHHLHFLFLLPLNFCTLFSSFIPLPSPYLHSSSFLYKSPTAPSKVTFSAPLVQWY